MRRVEKKKETFSRRFLNSRELPPDCINKSKSSSNGSASSAYMDGATKRRRMMQESSNYTDLQDRANARLRELAPGGQGEPGRGIHAT